jgi:hypothetical protein
VGSFRNGVKEGEGEIFYGNGAYFKGRFTDDRPNGYGVMRFNPATIYEGNYRHGLKSGSGKMTSPEGVYSGNWDADEKNGPGLMQYSNQDEYEGGWKGGLREGDG